MKNDARQNRNVINGLLKILEICMSSRRMERAAAKQDAMMYLWSAGISDQRWIREYLGEAVTETTMDKRRVAACEAIERLRPLIREVIA